MGKRLDLLFSAEADSHPDTKVTVDVVATEHLDTISLLFEYGEEKESHVILEVCRDQWGVWYHFNQEAFTVAQEDGTRSVLDALIKALEVVKYRNEMSEPAKILVDVKPEA